MTNDAIEDERRGLLYNIRIRLLKDKVKVKEQGIQLAQLVSVSAEVKTDSSRVIDRVPIPLDRHVSGSTRGR